MHAPFLEKCHTRNSTLYDITQGHKKKLSKNLLKPLFHRNYLEQFVPELFSLQTCLRFHRGLKQGFSTCGARPLWLPTAPGVCVCLFTTHCCVCALGWVKCRAQIPSMGHHSWPHVTSFPFSFQLFSIVNKSECMK